MRTLPIIPQGFFEIGQIPILVRSSNCTHALHLAQLSIFERQLDRQEGRYIFWLNLIQSGPQHEIH